MSRARGLGAAGSSRRVVPTAARRRHVEPEQLEQLEQLEPITADELERAFARALVVAPEVVARALAELSAIFRGAGS